MREDMEMIYQMIDLDDRVKAVVLTGAGRMFCAGADLEAGFVGSTTKAGGPTQGKTERDIDHRDGYVKQSPRHFPLERSQGYDSGGRVSLAIHNCSKPTVVAMNGSAVGVGMTMTLPCAIRVVSATAKCGFVFARRGIIMEACSSYFLPRLIGLSRAIHLCTTGAVYPASSPLLSQLFSEVLPTPEATLARAIELATEIAENTSVVSTKLMRDLMYRGADSAEGAHLLDSKIIHGLFGGKDNNEGVQSFFQKRAPNFQGKFPDDAPAAYPWWEQTNIGYRPVAAKGTSKL
jgi:enoyl-CoA hydratase/carnithine racemase